MNKECSWQHELSEGDKLRLRLAWMNQNLIIYLIISTKVFRKEKTLKQKKNCLLSWSNLVNCPFLFSSLIVELSLKCSGSFSIYQSPVWCMLENVNIDKQDWYQKNLGNLWNTKISRKISQQSNFSLYIISGSARRTLPRHHQFDV